MSRCLYTLPICFCNVRATKCGEICILCRRACADFGQCCSVVGCFKHGVNFARVHSILRCWHRSYQEPTSSQCAWNGWTGIAHRGAATACILLMCSNTELETRWPKTLMHSSVAKMEPLSTTANWQISPLICQHPRLTPVGIVWQFEVSGSQQIKCQDCVITFELHTLQHQKPAVLPDEMLSCKTTDYSACYPLLKAVTSTF